MRIKTIPQPQTIFFRTDIPLKSAAGEEGAIFTGGAKSFQPLSHGQRRRGALVSAAEVCVDRTPHLRGMRQVANHAASAPASPPHQYLQQPATRTCYILPAE